MAELPIKMLPVSDREPNFPNRWLVTNLDTGESHLEIHARADEPDLGKEGRLFNAAFFQSMKIDTNEIFKQVLKDYVIGTDIPVDNTQSLVKAIGNLQKQIDIAKTMGGITTAVKKRQNGNLSTSVLTNTGEYQISHDTVSNTAKAIFIFGGYIIGNSSSSMPNPVTGANVYPVEYYGRPGTSTTYIYPPSSSGVGTWSHSYSRYIGSWSLTEFY